MKRQSKTYFFHTFASLCAFLLLGMGKVHGTAPFALGLFAGLTYAGWNVFALAPAYLVASLILEPSEIGALLGVVPSVIFISACVIKRAVHTRISVVEITLCSAVSATMRFLVEPAHLTTALVYVALSVASSYAFIIALYATVVRGVGYRLSGDEKVCLAVLTGALTFGVFSCKVGDITPYWAVCAFGVLFAVYAFDTEGVMFALAMGVGGTSLESVCAMTCAFVSACIFKKHSRLLATAGVVVADLTVACLSGTASAMRIASVVLGALLFFVVPKKKMARLIGFFGTFGEGYAMRSLVNRNRTDVREKIKGVSRAFYLAEGLTGREENENAEEIREALCADLEAQFCDGCPSKKGCHKLLGGDARGVLNGVVDSALASGRATLLDLPPYLTGSCARVDKLIDLVNVLTQKYQGSLKLKRGATATKRLVASVMTGLGKMMDEIADTLGVSLDFDASREARLADELNHVGVPSESVAIYGEGRRVRVCVVTDGEHSTKHAIVRASEKCLNLPMTVLERKDVSEERCEVWLMPAPEYEVVMGRASVAFTENACGDTMSGARLADGRCLIALSDGMGAGKVADEESAGLVAIVENFMNAGFSSESVLPVVNKLMLMRGTERFQTLDLAVIDTATGNADVIKMGACPSFLVRDGEVRVIAGSALPVGILDDVRAHTDRIRLVEGDVLVMFSDGLVDTLGELEVANICSERAGKNPQSLCDALVERAKLVGLKDDVSVLAVRLFKAR